MKRYLIVVFVVVLFYSCAGENLLNKVVCLYGGGKQREAYKLVRAQAFSKENRGTELHYYLLEFAKELKLLSTLKGFYKKMSKSHIGLFGLGYIAKASGNLMDAKRYLYQAYNLKPDDGIVLYLLGSIYNLEGEKILAKKIFSSALSYAPNFPPIYIALGEYYLNAQNPMEAKKYFKLAMNKANKCDKNTYFKCLIRLGGISLELKDFDEATRLFKEAIKVNRKKCYKSSDFLRFLETSSDKEFALSVLKDMLKHKPVMSPQGIELVKKINTLKGVSYVDLINPLHILSKEDLKRIFTFGYYDAEYPFLQVRRRRVGIPSTFIKTITIMKKPKYKFEDPLLDMPTRVKFTTRGIFSIITNDMIKAVNGKEIFVVSARHVKIKKRGKELFYLSSPYFAVIHRRRVIAIGKYNCDRFINYHLADINGDGDKEVIISYITRKGEIGVAVFFPIHKGKRYVYQKIFDDRIKPLTLENGYLFVDVNFDGVIEILRFSKAFNWISVYRFDNDRFVAADKDFPYLYTYFINKYSFLNEDYIKNNSYNSSYLEEVYKYLKIARSYKEK